jgi:hypothetical protein
MSVERFLNQYFVVGVDQLCNKNHIHNICYNFYLDICTKIFRHTKNMYEYDMVVNILLLCKCYKLIHRDHFYLFHFLT